LLHRRDSDPRHPYIAYLGKVSYGIYIFHMLVPLAFGYVAT
jgi:hypothetical protein